MESNILFTFLCGLIVGTFLDTITTIVLILVIFVFINDPLPVYLGGMKPQDIIKQLSGKCIKSIQKNMNH